MSAPELRPYQLAAVAAIIAARQRGVRRMVAVLPTGAGKTVIFAHLAARAKQPVLVLAHRDELVQQAKDKISRALLASGGEVAIEQGPLRAPGHAKVVVASIRSLHPERLEKVLALRQFGLVIYDECHHAAADDNRRVLEQLGAFSLGWNGTLLGVTATTARGDGKGLDGVFQEIVYQRGLQEMIAEGYLVPLRGLRVETREDLSSLPSDGDGDFRIEPLAEAIDIEERNALVARSIQELARDRRTLAFCVTVAHAQHLAKSLNLLGITAGCVHGEMPYDERVKVLGLFRQGRLQVLTNVAVLTEGFDDPEVSCVAMARPTRSPTLYTQCVGRGTRLFEGKKDCLVLDFVDVSQLSLCALPSLFGMPRHIDLQGERADEAAEVWRRIQFDHPGFEWEAGGITLAEVQKRAETFNPLTLQVDSEVKAISPLAWVSLGKAGLALHWAPKPGELDEVRVLPVATRGKRWAVILQGRERARFSHADQAVAAVDWEIEQRGPRALASAQPEAAWRMQRPSADQNQALANLKPARTARTVGEALHLLALARHAGVGALLQPSGKPEDSGLF